MPLSRELIESGPLQDLVKHGGVHGRIRAIFRVPNVVGPTVPPHAGDDVGPFEAVDTALGVGRGEVDSASGLAGGKAAVGDDRPKDGCVDVVQVYACQERSSDSTRSASSP